MTQRQVSIIKEYKMFDTWVVQLLNGIFEVNISSIFYNQDQDLDPQATSIIVDLMFDSMVINLRNVTSATQGRLHSVLVITHRVTNLFFNFERKGYNPENEYLTFSIGQGMRIWHDYFDPCSNQEIRKLYISTDFLELQKILLINNYIFHKLQQNNTKILQVPITDPNWPI